MFKRKSKAAKSSKKSTETKDHSKAYFFRTKHEEAPKVLSQRVSYANKRGKKRHVSNFNVEVGNDSHGIEQDILKVNTSKAIEHVAVPSVERNTPNGRRRRSKSRERQCPTRQRQASKISLADMTENHRRPRTPMSSRGTLYPRSEPTPRNKSPLCMMPMPLKSCTVPDLSLVKSSDSEESGDHSEDESCESVESTKENYAIPQKHEKHIPFKYRLLCSMDMGQYGANCAVPKINFDLEKQQAPQPWRMYIDGDQYTGTKYWSNGLVSTYEKPKDFVERQEGVWCEFQDWKSGHRYYSNGVITTWTRPANTDVFIDKKTGYRYLISRNCDDNEC